MRVFSHIPYSSFNKYLLSSCLLRIFAEDTVVTKNRQESLSSWNLHSSLEWYAVVPLLSHGGQGQFMWNCWVNVLSPWPYEWISGVNSQANWERSPVIYLFSQYKNKIRNFLHINKHTKKKKITKHSTENSEINARENSCVKDSKLPVRKGWFKSALKL